MIIILKNLYKENEQDPASAADPVFKNQFLQRAILRPVKIHTT
jgi:hypothetical protein